MQSVPNKTDLLGDLDPGLPVCKLQSSLLITRAEENNNSDGLHLQCTDDVPGPMQKQHCKAGTVIISFLQRSTLRNREVKSFAQGHTAEVAGLDTSQESGSRGSL